MEVGSRIEVREVPTNVDIIPLPVWRTFDARITLVWPFSGLARRLTCGFLSVEACRDCIVVYDVVEL